MERITAEQAAQLPSVRGFGNHQWSLEGLKQLCPYTLTTGEHNGKPYATTSAGNEGKYEYGTSELQAAYGLVLKQVDSGIYKNAFAFKVYNKYTSDKAIAAAKTYL